MTDSEEIKKDRGLRLRTARKGKFSGEELGKFIGVSKGQISNIENGTSDLTLANATVLGQVLGVAPDWLMTGKGDMKMSVGVNNTPSISTGKPEYIELPYIEHKARASFLEMINDDPYENLKTTYFNTDAPESKQKGAIVLEVNGDSMEPQLKHGSKVLAIPVPDGDWCYASGKIYAVIYQNYFVIKRITFNDQKNITLTSDNLKGGVVTIPINEVRFMWKIIEVHSKVE